MKREGWRERWPGTGAVRTKGDGRQPPSHRNGRALAAPFHSTIHLLPRLPSIALSTCFRASHLNGPRSHLGRSSLATPSGNVTLLCIGVCGARGVELGPEVGIFKRPTSVIIHAGSVTAFPQARNTGTTAGPFPSSHAAATAASSESESTADDAAAAAVDQVASSAIFLARHHGIMASWHPWPSVGSREKM
jgi:hypothetical protein